MMTEDVKIRAEQLKSLKKGDFIWVARKHPLFKTYSCCSEDGISYLGYDCGDSDADYDDSMHVLQAVSPTVYKPTKMQFVAKVINGENKDDIAYVFTDDEHEFEWGDFRFGQHVIRPHDHFRGYKCQDFYLDVLKFERRVSIDMKDVFFSKEECIKECRNRNTQYRSSRELKCIGKTINALKRQFDEFKKSDVFVDAQEQIEKDLAGKK